MEERRNTDEGTGGERRNTEELKRINRRIRNTGSKQLKASSMKQSAGMQAARSK